MKIYHDLFVGHKLQSISRWASVDEPQEQILDHVLEMQTSNKTVTFIAQAVSPWFFLGDAFNCDPFNLSWTYNNLKRVSLGVQPFEIVAINVAFSKQYDDVIAIVLKGMEQQISLVFHEDSIHVPSNKADIKNGVIDFSKYSHFNESELVILST